LTVFSKEETLSYFNNEKRRLSAEADLLDGAEKLQDQVRVLRSLRSLCAEIAYDIADYWDAETKETWKSDLEATQAAMIICQKKGFTFQYEVLKAKEEYLKRAAWCEL